MAYLASSRESRVLVLNVIALCGYLFSIIWRFWGFSSLVCALALLILGAKPRQYLGVIVAETIYALFLYCGFQLIGVGKLFNYSLGFLFLFIGYWWVTRARHTSET